MRMRMGRRQSGPRSPRGRMRRGKKKTATEDDKRCEGGAKWLKGVARKRQSPEGRERARGRGAKWGHLTADPMDLAVRRARNHKYHGKSNNLHICTWSGEDGIEIDIRDWTFAAPHPAARRLRRLIPETLLEIAPALNKLLTFSLPLFSLLRDIIIEVPEFHKD